MLLGGQTRIAFTPGHISFFGIDTQPGVRPVHSKFPHRVAYFCNAWPRARDIDLSGPQAELEIKTMKRSRNNASTAFGYLFFRFIEPTGLRDYQAKLVH